MRARFVATIVASVIAAACSSMAPVSHETGFLNRTLTIGDTTYRYVVYVPAEYDPASRWPVALFLHGAGERGSDGWRHTAVGIGSAIRWHPERFPMIIVMPQAPADTRWLDDEADFAMQALDRTITEFNTDPDRTYLTGLSLGGYGSWHLALAHPDRFAAVVPVCGGIVRPETAKNVRQSPLTMAADNPYRFTAERLNHIPIWIFHGAEDPIIPPSESRLMYQALQREGADVRYTEYEGVGHGAWDPAYGEAELWEWMLRQRQN